MGWLPKGFVACSFVNFVVGAGLGGWMANDPGTWGTVGAIHGEINPFGWLTLLIYGMTYAVLAISAGLRPPRAWVGWFQLAVAESAVVAVVGGLAAGNPLLLRLGYTLQFAAPAVFLVNILSAVFAARRPGGRMEMAMDEGHPLAYLQRSDRYQRTDKVAQRGTDISLMLFLLAAGWTMVRAWTSPLAALAPAPAFVTYYGWIAGTVLSVSLHLFPRFAGVSGPSGRMFGALQVGWGIATVLGAAGLVGPAWLADAAFRLLGLVFALWAAVTLRWLWGGGQPGSQRPDGWTASRLAWGAAWVYSFILGIGLLLGLPPLSLAALHLLFLGFATNLVYGVGHALFPYVLRRRRPPAGWAVAQVAAGILGVLLMAVAFLRLAAGGAVSTGLLAVGGSLAALSAIAFLAQWAFAPRAAA